MVDATQRTFGRQRVLWFVGTKRRVARCSPSLTNHHLLATPAGRRRAKEKHRRGNWKSSSDGWFYDTMNTTRSLLERISPASTSTSHGQGEPNIQRALAQNEGGKQKQSAEISGSQLLRVEPASQRLTTVAQATTQPIASGSTRNRKRKRTEADNEDSGRLRLNEEPEKLSAPWFPMTTSGAPPQENATFMDSLHAELMAFTSYLSATPQERRARSLLVSFITALVRERWPAHYGRDGVVVHTFGSVATGLELPGGDIDLALEFPTNVELTAKDRKTRLFQLAAVLRSPERSTVVKDVHVVARARVPIIKIQTVDDLGGFSIDISIRQSSADPLGPSSSLSSRLAAQPPPDPALASISLIRSLQASHPELRHLVLTMKFFLTAYVDKDSGKDGLGSAATGGIGSYVLVCMCVAYLAHINLLEVQLSSQTNPAESTITEDASTKTNSSSKATNLGTLLMGFLRHYGKDFDYTENYVCSKRGVAPRRCTQEDGTETVWGEQAEKEPVETVEKKVKPVQEKLAVACLIDADKDVARGCSRLSEIRAAFLKALETLENIEKSAEVGRKDSIIKEILGIPESTMEQRDRVLRAVDSGRYEASLRRSNNPYHRDARWRGRDEPREYGRWRSNQYRQNLTNNHGNSISYRR
ncbi:Nucleotidyltransferase [Schizopora paradoxa]|uniref:polynucleotide adenylyltransferase n=1 Tax=Schizopora paradoxa TaxID=27342 RepID=A0A0H2STZ2_9AGAM|nr:Nucleotidyltransferase [Schizopora paradoxa]